MIGLHGNFPLYANSARAGEAPFISEIRHVQISGFSKAASPAQLRRGRLDMDESKQKDKTKTLVAFLDHVSIVYDYTLFS